MKLFIALAAAVLPLSGAQAAETEYGFDWSSAGSKCVKVTPKLIKGFKCKEAEANSASGHPHRVCSAADGKREYLIFRSRAHCVEELETQAANGP